MTDRRVVARQELGEEIPGPVLSDLPGPVDGVVADLPVDGAAEEELALDGARLRP